MKRKTGLFSLKTLSGSRLSDLDEKIPTVFKFAVENLITEIYEADTITSIDVAISKFSYAYDRFGKKVNQEIVNISNSSNDNHFFMHVDLSEMVSGDDWLPYFDVEFIYSGYVNIQVIEIHKIF